MNASVSLYRLCCWHHIRRLTTLESSLLEISLLVYFDNREADVVLSVHMGLGSDTSEKNQISTANLVLRRKKRMSALGFKSFRLHSIGHNLYVQFTISGEDLKQRDFGSIIKLLMSVCEALMIRIPSELEVKNQYRIVSPLK
jgi:hypothetical protein